MEYKYIIGIDEAGRGPLAGPVSVGAVLFEKKEYQRFKKSNAGKGLSSRRSGNDGRGETLRSVKDSKKLTEIQREKWFEKIKKDKNIRYIVCFTGAGQIDKFGIIKAVSNAIKIALKKLNINPNKCRILLDGTLKAPSEFINQKTIIKGDETEPVISLASIVAKVSRDRYIVKLAKKYPEYGFEKHKGYGTKLHYEMLGKHKLCNIHRRSFLKKLSN